MSDGPASPVSDLPRHPSLRLRGKTSAVRFFNPTSALLHTHESEGPRRQLTYNSRKARKGRIRPQTYNIHHGDTGAGGEPRHTTLAVKLQAVEKEFKPHLEVDVSFWVAVTFTLGSVAWVVNGFTLCLPYNVSYISESTTLTTVYYKVSASLAFVGGTLFEVGSYLLVVEALHRGRENEFGDALEDLLVDLSERGASTSEVNQDTLHAPGDLENGDSPNSSSPSNHRTEHGPSQSVAAKLDKPKFLWWGPAKWRDIGWTASFTQMCAATIFWVSTITGLPGVIPGFPDDPPVAITDVFLWTPQVVGGCGFILSSILFMLEVQRKWYLPNLRDLGWHYSFWNLIGSVGFTLCGAMGYSQAMYWKEQSGWSTFWGSWAFLISSLLQLYETVWREPVAKAAEGGQQTEDS